MTPDFSLRHKKNLGSANDYWLITPYMALKEPATASSFWDRHVGFSRSLTPSGCKIGIGAAVFKRQHRDPESFLGANRRTSFLLNQPYLSLRSISAA